MATEAAAVSEERLAPSDLVSMIARRATERFGGPDDGMFNAAGFSVAWREVTGLQRGLDGLAVSAIMAGREDIVSLPGGSHYRRLAGKADDDAR